MCITFFVVSRQVLLTKVNIAGAHTYSGSNRFTQSEIAFRNRKLDLYRNWFPFFKKIGNKDSGKARTCPQMSGNY